MEYRLIYQKPIIRTHYYLAAGGIWTPKKDWSYTSDEVSFQSKTNKGAKKFVRAFLRDNAINCNGQIKKPLVSQLLKVIQLKHN